MPGPADNALTGITLTNQEFLQPWQGGLVLIGYCLVIAAAGAWLRVRHDTPLRQGSSASPALS